MNIECIRIPKSSLQHESDNTVLSVSRGCVTHAHTHTHTQPALLSVCARCPVCAQITAWPRPVSL